MTSKKEITSKTIELFPGDKNTLLNENIIFIDFSPKNNLLLLLSSNNYFYICEIMENYIKLKRQFGSLIDKYIKIDKIYFCYDNPNLIFLLCDNNNILEWTVDREYISHIYYNVLGDIYEFKMNSQKNLHIENEINNFCIYKNEEINVWNAMKYNKKNILNMKNINCFSYDSTGLLLYVITKIEKKNYLKVIKFMDEYECKELYSKPLNFFDSKVNIDYINSFDVNIIMCDIKLETIYILKNYPINKVEFEVKINKSQFYLPLCGQNALFEFKLLCLNSKENEQKLITFNYKTHKKDIEIIKLSMTNLYYFKENNNGKGLLLVFDDLKNELKHYDI